MERLIYRLCRICHADEMDWKTYGMAMLIFNAAGLFTLYLLQRVQGLLPLNPAVLPRVEPRPGFQYGREFARNTNWQAYRGEMTLSYLAQMLGLTVQISCPPRPGWPFWWLSFADSLDGTHRRSEISGSSH